MKRTFELDVQRLKLQILRYARDKDIDSAVLVGAIADIMGMTAVVLDRHASYQDFDSRLNSFVDRARQSYQRASVGGLRSA